MDLKLKVILMLFVLIAVGYAIYFVFKDLSKKKKADRDDERITETYEDYDIRKQILNQLDTYKIDKKTKSTIYDTLSVGIETFKDMPEGKLNEMIREVVNKARATAKSMSGNGTKASREGFGEGEAISDIEEPEPEPPVTPAFHGAKDITNMIDTASSQIGSVEKSLSQIKTMVSAMAESCKPVHATEPSMSTTKVDEAPKEDGKVLTTSIEGFENFSGRGYSYL